jgi:ribokinase
VGTVTGTRPAGTDHDLLPEHAYQALRATAARIRVAVIGSLNVDLILHTGSEPPDDGAVLVRSATTEVGGHAGNCAAALAALGVSVALIAAVGVDSDGDLLLADLHQRGIDVRGVRRFTEQPTGRVVIPVFGDRHYMLLCRGANDLLAAADVDAALRERFDAILVFDPSEPALREIGQVLRRSRPPQWRFWTPGGIYAADPVAAQVISDYDVIFLNRAERQCLVEQVGALDAAAPDSQVVMTLGAEGSLLRYHGQEWAAPARRVPVVDPTGAGDAFAAGYAIALLAGLEPGLRLAVANVSGALAVGAQGARARLATLADLLAVTDISNSATSDFKGDL